MKLALVWNHRSRLLDCSFRFEQYLAGFEALGHSPVVVCDRASAQGFDGPLHVVEDAAQLTDPAVWRSTGADVAVIVTWHRMSAVLQAMRTAGLKVIAITDTDGQIGLMAFPQINLQRMLVYQTSWLDRLKCLKYWGTQILLDSTRASPEDQEFVASTRTSDAVIFGHAAARVNFQQFLRQAGADSLGQRLHVVPFTIGDALLSCPVPAVKDDRVVAIGRWSDPQKDAGLLAAALAKFLDRRATTEVMILGDGGDPWFTALAERHTRVQYLGIRQQADVARKLATARSIVFSSRWEGSPHAALEALASGATLVGPAIPSLDSWSETGRFGTVAASRRPRDLAYALQHEMEAWDDHQRDAHEISNHWRQRLAPAAVCQEMLEALPDRNPAS